MSLSIHTDPVPLRLDSHGDVRVGDSRVLLDLVVHAFNEGGTPETIVQSYSTLHLADVYAVIGYYLRHRAEVDDYLRERERQGEEVRRKIEGQQGDLTGIRERLLARQVTVGQNHAPAGQ